MLPRVSAALAHFIAPIATSGTSSEGTQPRFQRHQARQEPHQQQGGGQQPQAKVIPFPGAKQAEPAPSAQASPQPKPESAPVLLQLLNMLQAQRAQILRWIGPSTYQTAARQQKKTGRLRKGTIVDERAD